MRHSRRTGLVPGLLIGLVGAFAVVAAPLVMAPASAHDYLVDSDPADGASLTEAPTAVALTFSSPPTAIGTEVSVVDADGTEWADGDVVVVDNQVSQALRAGMGNGIYTVRWRVVSVDGHPATGEYQFGLGGVTPTATPEPEPEPEPERTAAAAPESEPTPLWPLAVGGGVAAVAIVAAVVIRRRGARG